MGNLFQCGVSDLNLRSITKEIDTHIAGKEDDIVFSFPEFTRLIGITWYHVVRQEYWKHRVTSDINVYHKEKKIVVTVTEGAVASGVFYHASITAIGY